jgi:hypothetical protein
METTIYEQRRDALISALRSETTFPFEAVDGPCGIEGEVGWPQRTRTLAIDFLAGIPSIRPADENKGLAQILGKAKGAFDATDLKVGGGVLFVLTSVRGERAAQAPMYFANTDFKALQGTLVSRHPTQIMPLLPFNRTGRNAPEHMSLWLLCAVGSDGALLWWNKEQRSWRGVGEKVYEEDWAAMKSAIRDRLPQIDKQRAIAFLDRAPVQLRHASDELPQVLAHAHDEKAAKQLLLGVTFSATGVMVTPIFLQSANTSDALWLIRPLRSGESMRELLGLGFAGANLDYACLISEEGRLIEFKQDRSATVDEMWKQTRSSNISDAWRQDAISALIRDGRYQGQYICWLQDTDNWPEELRAKVANYLKETVTVEPAARPTKSPSGG